MLEIKNLHAKTKEGIEILHGINVTIAPGEIHVIMGPNGSGKSTLSKVLLGHPGYEITQGSIILNGEDITQTETDERANAGLFLSMQYPPEIPGVTISNFLRTVMNSKTDEPVHPLKFHKALLQKMEQLHIPKSFIERYINTDFSGGEKKKAEILQLLMMDPTYAILDETDSGLDVDALRIVSEGINTFLEKKDKAVLLITHYTRILNYISPTAVHILKAGKIVKTGDRALAENIENSGYDTI